MRKFPEPGSIDVLFVTYGGGHVQMVLPVASELKRRKVRVAVLALTTAIPIVEAAKLDFFSFADFPASRAEEVRKVGMRLASKMPGTGLIPFQETVAYMGLNYFDLEKDLGKKDAAAAWKEFGRQSFHPKTTLREVITCIRPRLVVATNSPRAERAAIEAATELGISAAVMVDLFALKEIDWLRSPNYGKKLFVLNEAVRQAMIDKGRPPEDVVVTGNPAFDDIYKPSVIAAGKKLREARGYGRNGRLCMLYASGPEPERHPFTEERGDPGLPMKIESYLRELVSRNEKLEVVVRRHPSEDQTILQGDRVFSSMQTDNISILIHAIDIVIITSSTVGLQGYLAGKPVISLELSIFSSDAPYAEHGMAYGVKKLGELEGAIENCILKKHAQKTLICPPTQQNATECVVDNILSMI